MYQSKYPVPEVFTPSKDGFPHGNKKLLLLGPPGTGKTRAMLEAFLQPALTNGVEPEKILSCSFTRAAARELRDRLGKATGKTHKVLRETCATIHSEALRRFRYQFQGQKFTIIGEAKAATDEDDAMEGPASRFYEEVTSGGNMELKKVQAIKIWDLARNLCLTDWTSNAFTNLCRELAGKTLYMPDIRGWIEAYEKDKRAKKLLDFTDILIAALRCPAPERDLLIVDESQDCSLLQWKLVEKWAATSKFVVFCGDPDQCLYQWSGSRPEKVFDLIDNGYTTRRLGQSYRVPSKIHSVARAVILKNPNRIDAPYLPMEKEGSIEELTEEDASGELSSVVFDEDQDAFVLGRTAKILEGWADLLSDRGIPFVNERGKSPWGSPIALSVARAVMAIRENQPIETTDARRLVESFPGRDINYFNKGVTKKASVTSLTETTKLSWMSNELEALGLNLNTVRDSNLEIILKELGLEDRSYSIPRVLANHGTDALYKTPKVRLTTMHAAKGREADLVVVDLEMPTMTRIAIEKDPTQVEAERRLVYVALTRTKEALVLVRDGYDLGTMAGLPKIKS